MFKQETVHAACILVVKQATVLACNFVYFLFCYETLVMDRYRHEEIIHRSVTLHIGKKTYLYL